MSTLMIEQQLPDEVVDTPPLPGWFVPAALAATLLIGFVIWMLWTAIGPTPALANPGWVFLCH